MARRLKVNPDLIAAAQKAVPPARFPRGYFDPLVPVTRNLLDRGFRLGAAADWLIDQRTLRREHRDRFLQAMMGRLSRLRQKKIANASNLAWMESVFFDATHVVESGQSAAICGSTSEAWMPATTEHRKCARCLGIVRRKNLTIAVR